MHKKFLERNQVTKYLFIFLAINLIGIGVALILESRLGCDPIGLLCSGISSLLSVQFGIASFIYNALIIVVAILVARHNLGMGTIVYGLLSGFFIDFYQMILGKLQLGSRGVAYAILAFAIGEICMSLAFAILMQLRLGMTALDAVLVTIEKMTHLPYAYIKIGTDILMVVTGTIMGGIFGIGTIISALVTGALVARLTKIIEYFQNKKSECNCKSSMK